MHHDIISGDSGNPSFVIIEGKLVLLSTLAVYNYDSSHYGDLVTGPYYGDYEMIDYLKLAIEAMKDD